MPDDRQSKRPIRDALEVVDHFIDHATEDCDADCLQCAGTRKAWKTLKWWIQVKMTDKKPKT